MNAKKTIVLLGLPAHQVDLSRIHTGVVIASYDAADAIMIYQTTANSR